MMAPNNLFSPSSGKPIITPSQDIVLGCYYLTAEPRGVVRKKQKHVSLFGSKEEVLFAFEDGALHIHDVVRMANRTSGRRPLRRPDQQDHRDHRRSCRVQRDLAERNWLRTSSSTRVLWVM